MVDMLKLSPALLESLLVVPVESALSGAVPAYSEPVLSARYVHIIDFDPIAIACVDVKRVKYEAIREFDPFPVKADYGDCFDCSVADCCDRVTAGADFCDRIEAFIERHGFDVPAAAALRAAPGAVQELVLGRRGQGKFRNPSAALIVDIRRCKRIVAQADWELVFADVVRRRGRATRPHTRRHTQHRS